MNIGTPLPDAGEARGRVLGTQRKLHQWASDDATRRFDDLYNLVCDPAFLVEAWRRVRTNRGARSAGIDGETAYYVETVRGEQAFLSELRDDLKARRFQPMPVREVKIPKPGGKSRRLGIATVRDRVVQAALKLVLEPILEEPWRRTSSHAAMASVPGAERRTRSPRCTSSPPALTSGCSRPISRRASTKSRIRPC